MDHMELLGFARRITNETLREILDEFKREASRIHRDVVKLVEPGMDYTLRGGKRIRAFLVLTGYWSRRWGFGSIDSIRRIMAGVEFLQSYLLVHDDIMDRDEMRRGGPTIHVWFRDKCRETGLLGDCVHYGISQAITVGDYLESLAVYSIASSGFEPWIIEKLLLRYSMGLRMVAYGQFLDVLIASKRLSEVSEEDVYTIHRLKTASYTVELPLHLGVIASGYRGTRLFHELSRYAEPAGIAFQLVDDILGLYGDPRITGKPVGSDVREKKKTLLIVKAYELANSGDRRFLEEIYDHRDPREITEEDIRRVQEIVKETGSYEYNVEKIREFRERAEKALDDAEEISPEARDVLRWMTKYFIERKK